MIGTFRKLTWVGLLLMSLLSINHSLTRAQSSNGIITFRQEAIASGGGTVSANPIQFITAIGDPVGGLSNNGTLNFFTGTPGSVPSLPPGTRTITVTGTVDDPSASVLTNGTAASVDGVGNFSSQVTLFEGLNTISVEAVDPAGHRTTQTITVTLDTHPPARPTAVIPSTAFTASTYTLSGTKTPGTSVWVDGVEVVPLDNATTWSATVSLSVEGDNVFSIITKDTAGNSSATNAVIIVLDNLPPIIQVSAPSKTNLSPLTITGTVDDSLTKVEANGVLASRSGKTFTVAVPLTTLGLNTITVKATSPNGYISTKTLTVTLGSIPTITPLVPAPSTKLYESVSQSILATATDAESDPIEYQFLLNGTILQDWGATSSASWTPSLAQLGRQVVEVKVRDGFGGESIQQSRVYVIRKPVPPQ